MTRAAPVFVALISLLTACAGAGDPPGLPCSTPVMGLVQLLYPVPNSTSVPIDAGVAIYGIAQPFPNSGTIGGQGPFPITLSANGSQVQARPTSMPSPIPSPMATPIWPADQQSETYAVRLGPLTRGTTYTITATVPTFVCGTPDVKNFSQTLGTFVTSQ
jgi:hypothetical protein